ncbi:hypothetical protein LEMLEM_LOCUS25911 [Lemmus lemmus]
MWVGPHQGPGLHKTSTQHCSPFPDLMDLALGEEEGETVTEAFNGSHSQL